MFRRIITKKRKNILEDEIVKVVQGYKKREDVECIWFRLYKEPFNSLFINNVLWLNIVFKEPINDEIKHDFRLVNEKYNNNSFKRKSGVDFIIEPSSRMDYKIWKHEDISADDKDIFCNKEGVLFRALYFSHMVYDKDGYYNLVKHQFDNYLDMDNYNDNLEIDLDYSKPITLVKRK